MLNRLNRWLIIVAAILSALACLFATGAWVTLLMVTLVGVIGIIFSSHPLRWAPIGILGPVLILAGALGTRGVVDFHTFWRHPYTSVGKFILSVVLAAIIFRVVKAHGTTLTPWQQKGVFLAAVAMGGMALVSVFYKTTPPYVYLDRMTANGSVDEQTLTDFALSVAASYEAWGPVEGYSNAMYRFGPSLCRGPGGPEYRMSDAPESEFHGRKLYIMWAKNQRAYQSLQSLNRPLSQDRLKDIPRPDQTGQIVVKETFVPVPARELLEGEKLDHWDYQPGKRGDLFIVAHIGSAVKGTDNGWIYATVKVDRKTVTGIGRMENCMSCHTSAPHDRLFGLPSDW